MEMLGLGLPQIISIVTVLGVPGLVLIIWHGDRLRFERLELQRLADTAKRDRERLEELSSIKDQFSLALKVHEERHREVVLMYKDNVELVKHFDKLANDLTGVITLVTQTLTRVVDRIDNNQFCPMVRGKGPNGC